MGGVISNQGPISKPYAADANSQNNSTMGPIGMMAASTGAQMLNSWVTAKGQHKRQKELMNKQQQNQKELNRQGQELQMQTWKDTNYPAQVAMMKEAGVNPAVLYGQGGAGGATTGTQSGGTAAGGTAPMAKGMDIASILQTGMMQAQIDNLNAQTKKTETETVKIGGTDTEESQARIDKFIAETMTEGMKGYYYETQAALNKANTKLTQSKTTLTDQELNNLRSQNDKLIQEIRGLKVGADISEETKEAVIKGTIEKQFQVELENELLKAKTELTTEQKDKIWHDIWSNWTKTGLQGIDTIGNLFGKLPEMIMNMKPRKAAGY